VRIPLGVVFVLFAANPTVALGILVLAGVSDVLDGWAARRNRPPGDHSRHRGDWLDPLCDKLFVAAVLLGVYLAHRPPLTLLLLVLTRELLQTTSMLVYQAVPSLRRGLRYNYRAHPLGKATTVLQFITATALLYDHPAARPLAIATAVVGAASVAVYLNRARALARSGGADGS
jgi:cardiolipin synthase